MFLHLLLTAITYSSFVNRKEDVYKASMVVCFCNSAFSILGGFAVCEYDIIGLESFFCKSLIDVVHKLTHFLLLVSIIGWVAEQTGQTVEETAKAVGPGLAFFTVAEAMGLFGDAQNVMSVLFYVMLLTLGLVRLVLSMSFHYSHPPSLLLLSISI